MTSLSLYKKYASLNEKLVALEEEKQSLRAEILAELKKSGIDKDETAYGTFSVMRMPRWTYSEAVTKLEEKLKITQIKEQQKGLAKAKYTEGIRYTAVKEK